MTAQQRFGRVLDRLATATSVMRTRAMEEERATRNGKAQTERLEATLTQLEAAADDLCKALRT